MILNILLFVILIAVFASLMNLGLWSNTLTLINVITAGLLATNYFEPLAGWFDQQLPSYTYVYDFLALWLIFGITVTVLRIATDYMSPVKVRFLPPIDKAGGIVMAIWAGWVVVCFATMTLHTAPLATHFLWGGFQPQPDTKMMFRLAPDRKWLAWVHRESQGPLSRLHDVAPFDPAGDFILRYHGRRAEFEKQLTFGRPKGGGPTLPALPGQ